MEIGGLLTIVVEVGLTSVTFSNTETALARVEASSLQRVFQVNAFGPILVSKVPNVSHGPCCVASAAQLPIDTGG
jgi:hypothetical protein